MRDRRTYDDPCGIARALDLVGERWALLVVRELVLGPKRFTDLNRGLPTASQNVLSQRLRELTDSGVVRRRRLGPPTSAWVYELTEWGHDLGPVLMALARWGNQAPITTRSSLSPDALMLALYGALRVPEEMKATYELRFGTDHFRCAVADGRIEVVRGDADHPDVIAETDVETLTALAFGPADLAELRRSESLRLKGTPEAVSAFIALFSTPRALP